MAILNWDYASIASEKQGEPGKIKSIFSYK